MGIIRENTDVKYGKLFLVLAFLFVVFSAAQAQRKIDCRKFVFAPPCRGIAAKRDTTSHSDNLRVPPLAEDNDYVMDGQKVASNDNFAALNGLLGLLKKAISSKNVEYDPSSNYLA